MALRQEAMRAGLQVRLAKLDDPTNIMGKLSCVAYRLPRALLCRKTGAWMVYRNRLLDQEPATGWQSAPGFARAARPYLEKTAQLLSALPEGVIAFESTPGFVACYWWEEGDSDDVATIHRLLRELVNLTADIAGH